MESGVEAASCQASDDDNGYSHKIREDNPRNLGTPSIDQAFQC